MAMCLVPATSFNRFGLNGSTHTGKHNAESIRNGCNPTVGNGGTGDTHIVDRESGARPSTLTIIRRSVTGNQRQTPHS